MLQNLPPSLGNSNAFSGKYGFYSGTAHFVWFPKIPYLHCGIDWSGDALGVEVFKDKMFAEILLLSFTGIS